MKIFDIIKNILSKENDHLYNDPEFNEGIQNNYMLTRWVSMTSVLNSFLLNETVNKMTHGISEDKETLYKLLYVLIDKSKQSRINYIKRDFKGKDEDLEKILELYCNKLNISRKELLNYINFFEIDETKMKEKIKG